MMIGASDLDWGSGKASLMFELLARKTRSSEGKGWEGDGIVGTAHSEALWPSTFEDLRGSQDLWV